MWNDLRYVFIIFCFEKERSALDTVTGDAVNNAYAVARSRTDDKNPSMLLLINLSKFGMDSEAAISVLNSRRNERYLDLN